MNVVKKFLVAALSLALLLALLPVGNVSATQKKVKLNKSKATIFVGETVSLKLKNNKGKIKWSSSNKTVASVSKKGKVTGMKDGKATIIAKAGKKKYKCKVTVKKAGAPGKSNTTGQPTTTPDTTEQPTTPDTPEEPTTPDTPEEPTTPDTPEETPDPVSEVVEWTVTSETFMGAYVYQNEETNEEEIIPKELTRKYVSFAPWPTTNEQIEYVMKNCDDPYVIGALYIVALDNFEYKGLGNYSGVVYKMLDTLMSGAGSVTGTNYQLSNFAKQQICGFGNKQVIKPDGIAVNVSTFASRAYLKGATPYNDYTPEGGLQDKTKWKIVMDEYVYCGDLANGYITVCPQRYSEEQSVEGGEKTYIEHWQGIRIGMRLNKSTGVWCPTDNVSLNTTPTGSLVPFNIEKQVIFSSNYKAPEPDQGF